MSQEKSTKGAGELTETLQIQAITLSIKALIATHPNPEVLGKAMRDLFAQFQATASFQRLSASQRDWTREAFSSLLPSSQDKEQ